MKNFFVIIFLCFSIANFSCKKISDITETLGTIRNYTGFDGCGFMIEGDDGKKFELRNVPNNFTLIANKRVSFKHRPAKNTFSICMLGEIVEVVSIEYI